MDTLEERLDMWAKHLTTEAQKRGMDVARVAAEHLVNAEAIRQRLQEVVDAQYDELDSLKVKELP